ncbi:hypothetical protein QTN25_010815 [Entamoeba marina]
MQDTCDLILLQHGISPVNVGVSSYFASVIDMIESKFAGRHYILKLLSGNSKVRGTSDGIYVGGLRTANEICDIITDIRIDEPSTQIRYHFIGHSLGGLYLRIAIYILFKRNIFMTPLNIPFNFITLETPHLGVMKPTGKTELYNTCYDYISKTIFVGATINDLTFTDRPYPPYDPSNLEELPLLHRMVTDEYLNCLRSFKHLTLIQNIGFSIQVPYISAAIDRGIPYNRKALEGDYLVDSYNFSEDYTDILRDCVRDYVIQDINVIDGLVLCNEDGCKVYDDIVTKLNTLPWRRINVHYPTKSLSVHNYLIGYRLRNLTKKIFENPTYVDQWLNVFGEMLLRDINIDDGTFVNTDNNTNTIIVNDDTNIHNDIQLSVNHTNDAIANSNQNIDQLMDELVVLEELE